MAILNVTTTQVGLVGVTPQIIYLLTNDNAAAITAADYLNPLVSQGYTFSNTDMALVYGTDVVNGGAGSNWFSVAITGTSPNFSYGLAEINSY